MVGAGYDAMVETWEAWAAQVDDDQRQRWTADLTSRLPERARVLELGCGGGTDETRQLGARFDVTGVDISERQLERARQRVPTARFVQADLTAVEFAPVSFDAIVALYVFNHVPRELLPGLLSRCHGWLVDGGRLLATFGSGDTEGWIGEWLGAPMFFSSFPPEANTRLVFDAGFAIERDEVAAIREPEGRVEFQWILATKMRA